MIKPLLLIERRISRINSIQAEMTWTIGENPQAQPYHGLIHACDWMRCLSSVYIRIRICLIDDCRMKLISFRLCCLWSDDSILIDVNLWMIETEFIIHHRSLIVIMFRWEKLSSHLSQIFYCDNVNGRPLIGRSTLHKNCILIIRNWCVRTRGTAVNAMNLFSNKLNFKCRGRKRRRRRWWKKRKKKNYEKSSPISEAILVDR